MSGGVDSSLAAALLVEAGYDVIGVTLRLWSDPDADAVGLRRCCSLDDAEDARRVCQHLGIPFYNLNFEAPFRRYVVGPFCQEYARGRTPNPCLACNEHIKFRILLQRALAWDAGYLATGHYATIEQRDGRYHLLQAPDSSKDQSYVLYTLGQAELQHLLFPVGGYTKVQVRAMAQQRGLPVARKPDSQEICFAPGDYRLLVAGLAAAQPGPIVDSQGRRLGEHHGLTGYTVGQRRGLGLAHGQPYYVTHLEPEANTLVVGPESELMADALWVSRLHLVSGEMLTEPVRCTARIRYQTPAAPATVVPSGPGAEVHFDRPQRAIAPGQAVVLYQGVEVLGGGTIERAWRNTGRGELQFAPTLAAG